MKKRILCPSLPMKGKSTVLPETEAHHATRVLRLREGEIVEAMDGKGKQALAILRVKGGPIRLEYFESEDVPFQLQKGGNPLPIILEMSVLKGEAMEWVVEKAVELGVNQLVPVLTAHTVVQMKTKGPELFQERWQKIADQALKQCGRLDRMEIQLPIPLEQLLTQTADSSHFVRLWCDEASRGDAPYLSHWLGDHSTENYKSWRLLIGPEGGWSQFEREILLQETHSSANQRVHLGPLILRAETAALFTTSLLTAKLRAQEK